MTKAVLAMTSVRADGGEALAEYLAVVVPLMEAAGVRLVSRHEISERLAGSEAPQFVSIVEYPNEQAIKSVFEHPDYRALAQVKNAAFSRYDVYVLD